MITNTHTAACNVAGGSLSSGGDVCVVAALNEYWKKAGIPTVSYYSMSVKILKLLED